MRYQRSQDIDRHLSAKRADRAVGVLTQRRSGWCEVGKARLPGLGEGLPVVITITRSGRDMSNQHRLGEGGLRDLKAWRDHQLELALVVREA
jgi:hypothetical protein